MIEINKLKHVTMYLEITMRQSVRILITMMCLMSTMSNQSNPWQHSCVCLARFLFVKNSQNAICLSWKYVLARDLLKNKRLYLQFAGTGGLENLNLHHLFSFSNIVLQLNWTVHWRCANMIIFHKTKPEKRVKSEKHKSNKQLRSQSFQ